MSWKPSSYETAARRRQMILDCIRATPGAHMGEIGAYLSARGDHGNASNTVRTMADWRELRFEGVSRTRRYFALVTTTRSAGECVAIREINLAAFNAARHRESSVPAAARYVHKPGEHPLPDQGGQGSLRAPVYVNYGGIYAWVIFSRAQRVRRGAARIRQLSPQ